MLGEGRFQVVLQTGSFSAHHIRMAEDELGFRLGLIQDPTQSGGVHQDPAVLLLADDLGEFHDTGSKHEALPQQCGVQCGRPVAAHRRKLRRVADQQQLAARCAEDMLEEVAEQIAIPKRALALPAVHADHRGFVHDEERAIVLMWGEVQ